MSRALNFATLLTIGAALSSTQAVAEVASVHSYAGPSDRNVTRDAPVLFPAKARARPLPRVGGLTVRGDLDAAAQLDGFATITAGVDGSVTETPASDAMRVLVTKR